MKPVNTFSEYNVTLSLDNGKTLDNDNSSWYVIYYTC